MRELKGDQRTHRLRHDYVERDGQWKFEIAVQRKQNEKNQQDSQRPHNGELLLGGDELIVLSAPRNLIAAGNLHTLFYGLLPLFHCPLQVAVLNAVLHADIAPVIFAIDE